MLSREQEVLLKEEYFPKLDEQRSGATSEGFLNSSGRQE